MQMLHEGYRGLSLLMLLNWDRALFLTAISIALFVGTWLGGL